MPQHTDFPRTLAVIHQGLAERLHIGAQLYVAQGGEVLADLAMGEACEGVPMASDTLMVWLSAGKPITAVALAQLWERGRLDLDDPVADHIPEFAARGKEAVTIRHLLNHTAGFRGAASNFSAGSWEQIIARICNAALEPGWVPGRKAGYHLASSWFILGELIRRLDGRPFDQYVREEIFLPLGMNDSWLGLSPEMYRAYGQRMGRLYDTSSTPVRPNAWDTEQFAAIPRPGGNARGPVRELGRFYQMLLDRGQPEILLPQTVEALTARHRTGMLDITFNHILDWGLGFIINSSLYGPDTPYGFGPYASPRTFGHGGSQSSGALADPEHGLVVAFLFNGTPGEQHHQQRLRALMAALYKDLELA